VAAYGLRVALCATDPPALRALVDAIPGEWRPASAGRHDAVFSLSARGTRRDYVLRLDDEELVRTRSLASVRESVIGWFGRYVAEHSRLRTFVHAGVVAVDGRAVVLPGRQNSGKTTLTAALVAAGAVYLSDEYAPLDDRGRVHPFARPLSFRNATGTRTTLRPVADLGGAQGTRPLPVALVALAPFTGARRWRPRALTPGRAVLDLLAFTVSAQTASREALERLGIVAMHAPVLAGGRGEAGQTARLILRRLRNLPPPS
jgi:hypothetical protein